MPHKSRHAPYRGPIRLRVPRFKIDLQRCDCYTHYFVGIMRILHCCLCGEWVPSCRYDEHCDECPRP